MSFTEFAITVINQKNFFGRHNSTIFGFSGTFSTKFFFLGFSHCFKIIGIFGLLRTVPVAVLDLYLIINCHLTETDK